MTIEQTVAYIIRFLLYGHEEAVPLVGYTADQSLWPEYSVVVKPNGHLGQDWIYPDMGKPVVSEHNGCVVVETDIIYNTCFFLSGAEELLTNQRDEHGRLPARFSILGEGDRLCIPLVDEYAHTLMNLLGTPLNRPNFSHISLTHDIDTLAHYRHLRGFVGGCMRGQWRQSLASIQALDQDPAWTFRWLLEEEERVPDARTIYFVKHTHGKGYDYPQYSLTGRDWQRTKQTLLDHGTVLGLHSSYYGQLPNHSEMAAFIGISGQIFHRAHYLRYSLDRLRNIAQAGITDDFGMAFADRAGFRMQTCRPYQWIDPLTCTLTPLTIHPLTMMDCTLSNTNYMNLSEEEALHYSLKLIDTTRHYSGELVLLWHNHIFNPTTYHSSLYPKLLKYLCQKDCSY